MNTKSLKILESLAKEASMKGVVKREVSIEAVRRVIRALYRLGIADFWTVTSNSGEYIIDVFKIMLTLLEKGIVERKDTDMLTLTNKGLQLAREDLKLKHKDFLTCKSCSGKTIVIEGKFLEIYKKYSKIVSNRPEVKYEYDQAPIHPRDAVNRMAFLYEKGDLEGKEIILLGDDDLVSLAIALTKLPERVAILDVDDELLSFIKKVSEKEELNIEVIKHDLRYPLPENLAGSFDVFFTDPPDTLWGLILFVSRGVESLRKDIRGVGYFCMTHADCPLERWKRVFDAVLKMGMVPTDIIHDFNTYVDLDVSSEDYVTEGIGKYFSPPKAPWYKSSLIRIEKAGELKPYIEGEMKGEELYDYLLI